MSVHHSLSFVEMFHKEPILRHRSFRLPMGDARQQLKKVSGHVVSLHLLFDDDVFDLFVLRFVLTAWTAFCMYFGGASSFYRGVLKLRNPLCWTRECTVSAQLLHEPSSLEEAGEEPDKDCLLGEEVTAHNHAPQESPQHEAYSLEYFYHEVACVL